MSTPKKNRDEWCEELYFHNGRPQILRIIDEITVEARLSELDWAKELSGSRA